MGRTDSGFTSGGQWCAAWLHTPDHPATAPRPLVVVGHGLGGTRRMGLEPYAERFAAAGYAVLVFDYRHFGDSEGSPRQLLHVGRQLEDWHAAIAHARGLDGVDPERIVVWGTSFGGGHVLRVAATDHRLAAAVAQCPFTDGLASGLAVSPLTSLRVGLRAVRDLVGARLGRAPLHLPAAAAPGTPAFMTAPDALAGISRLGAQDPDFDNRLTARSALAVLGYAPGRGAAGIRCPLHVALCGPDTVAPSRTAGRQVRRARRAEVTTYDTGHFDIYQGEAFDRAVEGYLDFLRRHVPVR